MVHVSPSTRRMLESVFLPSTKSACPLRNLYQVVPMTMASARIRVDRETTVAGGEFKYFSHRIQRVRVYAHLHLAYQIDIRSLQVDVLTSSTELAILWSPQQAHQVAEDDVVLGPYRCVVQD